MAQVKGTILGRTTLTDWSTGRAIDKHFFEAVDEEGVRYLFPWIEYVNILNPGDKVRIDFVIRPGGSAYEPTRVDYPDCSTRGCFTEAYVNKDGKEFEKCHDCIVAGQEYAAELAFGDR